MSQDVDEQGNTALSYSADHALLAGPTMELLVGHHIGPVYSSMVLMARDSKPWTPVARNLLSGDFSALYSSSG